MLSTALRWLKLHQSPLCGHVIKDRQAAVHAQQRRTTAAPVSGCAPLGREGAAWAQSAGGEASAPAPGGAPVEDHAKVVGAGLLCDARVGEGTDGVELDGVGLQSQVCLELVDLPQLMAALGSVLVLVVSRLRGQDVMASKARL